MDISKTCRVFLFFSILIMFVAVLIYVSSSSLAQDGGSTTSVSECSSGQAVTLTSNGLECIDISSSNGIPSTACGGNEFLRVTSAGADATCEGLPVAATVDIDASVDYDATLTVNSEAATSTQGAKTAPIFTTKVIIDSISDSVNTRISDAFPACASGEHLEIDTNSTSSTSDDKIICVETPTPSPSTADECGSAQYLAGYNNNGKVCRSLPTSLAHTHTDYSATSHTHAFSPASTTVTSQVHHTHPVGMGSGGM